MDDGESSGPKDRVLILTASLGAGHKQAARAIADHLGSTFPHLTVTVRDALEYAGPFFRACYAGIFVGGMTRLPRLWGWGFEAFNAPQTPTRSTMEKVRLWTERRAQGRLVKFLCQHRPHLVLNTHFLSAPVVSHWLERCRPGAAQMTVGTDHDLHRWWYCEGVDHWFVPDEQSLAKTRRWGIPPRRVTVSGIPVHPKWTCPLDREKIYVEWRLPADRPIVVLSGGTEFLCGPVVSLATGILRACPAAQVVVLAGRNKKLLGELSALPQAGRRLTPVAFTDRVHELVEVASLMVTKPGGITTAECCAKGTAMVLLPAVPGQEAGNARHLVGAGAAVAPGGSGRIVQAVRRLLEDPPELARMSARARGLHRPATEIIVRTIGRWLDSSPARGG